MRPSARRRRWIADRERRLEAFLAAGVIHVEDRAHPEQAPRQQTLHLPPGVRSDVRFDRARDQFYVELPAPFTHVRLYERMRPTFEEMAVMRAAVRSLGGTFTDTPKE